MRRRFRLPAAVALVLAGCISVAAADGRLRLWWERPELRGIPGQTSDAGGTVGHVLKVRFHLHRATLFGFQVGEETSFPGQAD